MKNRILQKHTRNIIYLLAILLSVNCSGCGFLPSEKTASEATVMQESLSDEALTDESLLPADALTPIEGNPSIEEGSVSETSVSMNNADTLPQEIASEELNDASADTPNVAETDIPTSIKPTISTKGIYVTGPVAGSKRMDDLIELVTSTELNTMVIDVKNDEGNLTYKMELPEGYDYDAGVRYVKDMEALNSRLHELGIYTIGRIVCFKDPVLASANPELALCSPGGQPVTDANGLSWVNPYREEVWDYLCTIAESAMKDGFDEIQFDYIRFPIGKEANAADYGVDMSSYTREDGLNDFFTYLNNRLHAQNIIFGADLFGTVIGSDIDRDRTGQSYPALAQMTDAVCPMIYPSHYANGTFGLDVPDAHPYETIYQALTLSQKELADYSETAVVRPWLQCFNAVWVNGHITYDSNAIRDQIQAVYDAGYEEWLLWNASNHYEQVAEAFVSVRNKE